MTSDDDSTILTPDEEVDITPEDLEEHAAKTYPIGPNDHIGISTDDGADPATTDQADEQEITVPDIEVPLD